jgi:hypothetical protein
MRHDALVLPVIGAVSGGIVALIVVVLVGLDPFELFLPLLGGVFGSFFIGMES